jgi:integrase
MKGHLRKRGDRTWAVIVDVGRDADGKRRQRWHSVKGSKRDAEREMAKILHEMNTGSYVEPAKITVGEYLDRWLADYAKHNVAGKTFERYEDIVDRHLKPDIGHIPMPKLKPLHIQGLYSKALTEGRSDGRGGLSPQTVLHCHRVLRGALQQAVRWQLLAQNPADAVKPPRPARREMRALDDDGIKKLLDTARGSRLYWPVLLAVSTGMRRGELLALRWSSVDLDRSTLSVSEALEETRNGLRFKQPKTARSRRTVDLPSVVSAEMRTAKVATAKQKLALGPAYEDQNLVFAKEDGSPWPPDNFSTAFVALAGKAGLEGFRLHDLRHTHATQLLKQGVHPKIVSERLGHSTVSITLDTYSHVLPGIQREAVDALDVTLRRAIYGGNGVERRNLIGPDNPLG